MHHNAAMKRLTLILMISAATAVAQEDSLSHFIHLAKSRHGGFGERAAKFLVAHMPQKDRESLSSAFLIENLDLAVKARESFPWAKKVPEAIFFNDVLPYAVFDEPRDPWRADFLKKATPIVEGAKTASEAAQRLNQSFFKVIQTHYHPGRKRANQSPRESIEQRKASCTGLSIILVDACRAVGIPARAVGIPLWPDKRGNHMWVEIHDQGQWHYTGADEYNAGGLNHAWFSKAASMADADNPLHSIYATSWQAQGTHFPLVWANENPQVGAVNVTSRYAAASAPANQIGVRLFANSDRGSRIATRSWLIATDGQVLQTFNTKAGTSDLNDMPQVPVTPGQTYRLRFMVDGRLMESPPFTAEQGTSTIDMLTGNLVNAADAPACDAADDAALTRQQAAAVIQTTYGKLVAAETDARGKELEQKSITLGGHRMRWQEKTFGEAPAGGRSLWISMHGGGQAPEKINTQQWHNQINLYQPKEGIYLAPRAPTDTWNMWHLDHIDLLFSRLIENMVALRGVNPDKVYLMGYSAGGDGVWQVAPRMADRFAAASMMAGHPNEAKMLGLRNLPFGIFCGSEDSGVKRNKVCAERMQQIEEMHKADPGGYIHMTRLYEGMGHWMMLKDAESVPWMAGYTRNNWPDKIVWHQDDVTHDRFYWLELPDGTAREGRQIVATLDGDAITLKGEVPPGMRLLLHDDLLDLDKPVQVTVNDGKARSYQPKRSAKTIRDCLEKRLDPASAASACITLD
jgi:hypothetical protein